MTKLNSMRVHRSLVRDHCRLQLTVREGCIPPMTINLIVEACQY
jgi:hypothetical protein